MGAKLDHAIRTGRLGARAGRPCVKCDLYMCECNYDCGTYDQDYADRLASGEMD